MRFKIPTEVAREAIALLASGSNVVSVSKAVGISRNSLYRLRDHVLDWFAYEDSLVAKTIDGLRNRIQSLEDQGGRHEHRRREVNRLRVQLSSRSSEVIELRKQLQNPCEAPSVVHRARVEKPRSLTPQEITRPENRSQCVSGGINAQRPCPWVSCRYHLAIDVRHKHIRQHNDPEAMTQTCVLDVAELGGRTLDEIGTVFGLTRERIRQIEVKALLQLRKRFAEMQSELKE